MIKMCYYNYIFSRLSNVCYCTAYYNIETFIFFTVSVAYKIMVNQYIKVNESYRIIIPIISSHFCFFYYHKDIFQCSMSFKKVINNILLYYHIFCDIVLLEFFLYYCNIKSLAIF